MGICPRLMFFSTSLQSDQVIGGVDIFSPDIKNCTDNGSMIAITGYHRLKKGQTDDRILVRPRWDLSEI